MSGNYIKTAGHDCITCLCNPVGIDSFNSIVFMPPGFGT